MPTVKPNSRSIALTCMLASAGMMSFQANANGRPSPLEVQAAWVTIGDSAVGDASLSRNLYMFDARGNYALSRHWSLGWGLGYDVLDYSWRTVDGRVLGGAASPWNSINRYNVSVNLGYRSGNWLFGVSPMLQYAWADTASSTDARSWGLVASAMHRFDNGNMLGLGAIYLDDIGETRALPFLAVRWQLTDALILSNPFDAGFSGPAGLELSYRFSPKWEVALGSSRRSQRILLTDEGQTAQLDEWVSFLRLGWQIGQKASINAYGGLMFAGELELGTGERETLSSEAAAAIAFKVAF